MLTKVLIASTARAARVSARRGISTTRYQLAATLLKMPAMSPTMTEGGIVEWKVKEGDSFSAGDILLEIETDKAQIDVEAQDDGILAKIYEQNGAKNVQVGAGIAALAEPGDDISAIELPGPSSESAEPSAKPEEKAEEPSSAPEPKKESSEASIGGKANPKLVLLPSVQSLLHSNSISAEDAYSKIPASGPNGRLLKGDVLAYLGTISQDSVNRIAENIKSLQHLDLSNIKLRSPEQQAAAEEKKKPEEEQKKKETEKPKKEAPKPVVLEKSVWLGEIEQLRASVDAATQTAISTQALVDKAVKLAQRDVPKLSQPKKSVLRDEVFEQLIAPAVPRGAKPFEVNLKFQSKQSSIRATTDIYDLLGSPRRPLHQPTRRLQSTEPTTVDLKVTTNPKVPGSTEKAKIFLDRLEYYLTNGKGNLVL
ncbi:pyruvate dehydrogenase complex protein X component, mitochondrial [Trichomonascus vanleenenianus]|uniref:Pdx1p n=1 Tax=Trichomonascus vanleenenianus TaxID=2268995 RepID=UPI003ECB8A70